MNVDFTICLFLTIFCITFLTVNTFQMYIVGKKPELSNFSFQYLASCLIFCIKRKKKRNKKLSQICFFLIFLPVSSSRTFLISSLTLLNFLKFFLELFTSEGLGIFPFHLISYYVPAVVMLKHSQRQ